jgi:hypothetical protein
VKRITISDTVVKFRRIKKRTVVYLFLVKRCYHLERLLIDASFSMRSVSYQRKIGD